MAAEKKNRVNTGLRLLRKYITEFLIMLSDPEVSSIQKSSTCKQPLVRIAANARNEPEMIDAA